MFIQLKEKEGGSEEYLEVKEEEHENPNQYEEVPVIIAANTIIKPVTVMVKVYHTSVASSAVLGCLVHVPVADITPQVQRVIFNSSLHRAELFFLFNTLSLGKDDWISRILKSSANTVEYQRYSQYCIQSDYYDQSIER